MNTLTPLRLSKRGAIHTAAGSGGAIHVPGTHTYALVSQAQKPGTQTCVGEGRGSIRSTRSTGGALTTTTSTGARRWPGGTDLSRWPGGTPPLSASPGGTKSGELPLPLPLPGLALADVAS